MRVAGEGHIEPRADGEEKIAILQREIRPAWRNAAGATGMQRIVICNQIKPEPGGLHGDVEQLHEFGKLRDGACDADAVAGHQHRTLGFHQQRHGFASLGEKGGFIGCFVHGLIGREAGESGRIDGHRLHIERDIEPDGAGAAFVGEVHRFIEMVGDGVGVRDRHRVFGDGLHDVDDADFLIAELAQAGAFLDIRAFYLAGEKQAWRRIQPRAGEAGDGVGGAGAGGDHAHAKPAGDPRIGFRRDGGGLLVQVSDEGDVFALAQRIVEMHRAAAGDEEDMLYVLFSDALKHIVGKLHPGAPSLFKL